MPTILIPEITVSNAVATRILDAFALEFNYPDNIPNPAFDPQLPVNPAANPAEVPNPQSKADFFLDQIRDYIKRTVLTQEEQEAMIAVRGAMRDISL